jgi:lipopolysaccharide transport system permease protein
MRALLAYLALAWPLAKRDVHARYRGSALGAVWTLVGPLSMVAIYALVFQGVYQARWPGASSGGVGFALRMFAGLIVFSSVAEVASRATRLIQDHANLVKRVVFPLELLCVALVMQVCIHAGLQLLVLGVLQLAFGDGLHPSLAWLLVLLPWTAAIMLTCALGMAALGCYLRDLQHLVPLAMSGLMFLSPIFYPAAAAPASLKVLLALNPLSVPIEAMRAAWFGTPYQFSDVLWPVTGTIVAWFLARSLFQRLRPGFADLV